MTTRETLAVTAAALAAVSKAYALDHVFVTLAGHRVAIGVILDEANRVLGEPIPEADLARYLDQPEARLMALPDRERSQLGGRLADELTGIVRGAGMQPDPRAASMVAVAAVAQEMFGDHELEIFAANYRPTLPREV